MTIDARSPIHYDDLKFFNEVADAMRKVADARRLPLRSVTAFPMPASGMADRMGDCRPGTGDVRIVMRCTVDGEWSGSPVSPAEVWETAAHELAHLRIHKHGPEHDELTADILQSLTAVRPSARERVIAKLIKMQASRAGEAALGNEAAAEAFADAINRMLLEHELDPSALDYARAQDDDPVVEIVADLRRFGADDKRARIGWQESLARVVAHAHLCTFLVRRGSNRITFVGTRSHATVAEYAYGTLVAATDGMAWTAYNKMFYGLKGRGEDVRLARGFRQSWLAAFVERIAERLAETRRAAVAAAPGGPSQGLMRLSGALAKARSYVDDKFAGRGRPLQAARMAGAANAEGKRLGRTAADGVALGQRGVGAPAGPRGLLK